MPLKNKYSANSTSTGKADSETAETRTLSDRRSEHAVVETGTQEGKEATVCSQDAAGWSCFVAQAVGRHPATVFPTTLAFRAKDWQFVVRAKGSSLPS